MTDASEEYATEPVPDHRTVPWLRVAIISAMVAFSLPTFVTGIEVAQAVDGRTAALAILCGNLLLAIIGAFCGAIGARTRLSSYMLTRIAFGWRGAMLVNLAFAVSLLGWFGVNIDLFSAAVERLLVDVFSASVPAWLIECGAGIVMTVTTIYGFRAINTLSILLVPILMVVTAMLINQSLDARPLTEILASPIANPLSFGAAMSSVVGGVIIGAVILPDITRFIREWRGGIYTAIMSYAIIGSIVQGAGGLAAIAFGNDDLLDVMIVIGLSWAAFAIVIAGSWILNSLNLYSTSLSIEATLPGLDNRLLIIVLGVFGTVAAFLNILDYFPRFPFLPRHRFRSGCRRYRRRLPAFAARCLSRRAPAIGAEHPAARFAGMVCRRGCCAARIGGAAAHFWNRRARCHTGRRSRALPAEPVCAAGETAGGKSVRIGIDVGGTHTDAVILDGNEILASTKALTSADVSSGILEALEIVLTDSATDVSAIDAVMLGTTQFTNAVVERQELAEVAAIRIGLPSGNGLPPKTGWPADIAGSLGSHEYQVRGGTLYDGLPLAELDLDAVDAVIADIKAKNLEAVAIAAAFSPMNPEPETVVAERLLREIPGARVHAVASHWPYWNPGARKRRVAQCVPDGVFGPGGVVVSRGAQNARIYLPVFREPERRHANGRRFCTQLPGADVRIGTDKLPARRLPIDRAGRCNRRRHWRHYL